MLELGAHLLVILNHFMFLNFFPVLLHVLLDGDFAVFHGLLGLLLVCHVAHQHFALKCLDHVLLLVHRLVRPLDLQTSKFVLVVLLFRILVSAINLHSIQKQTLSPTVSIRHSAIAVISYQKFNRLC